MTAWLVSLETMHTDDAMRGELTAALAAVGGELSGPDSGRTTARVLVPGSSPAEALATAMDVWRAATETAGRPGWPVFAADIVERVDPVPAGRRGRRSA